VLAGRKRHALIVAVVVAVMGAASVAALPGPSHRRALQGSSSVAQVRSSRGTDWQEIQGAASLRKDALQPNLTAFHRAFAAYMALSALIGLRNRLSGRCAVAVTYLYNNLLDLHDAYTGEDWTALRQAVATEPSLEACAPRPRAPREHVRYVE
jgi:hypothetical protein